MSTSEIHSTNPLVIYHMARPNTITSLPAQPLMKGSLHVQTNSSFAKMSNEDHAHSFRALYAIAKSWQAAEQSSQYLIYSKVDSTPFKWEIVPYQKANFFTRIVQQIKVLWRTIFGGLKLSEKDQDSLKAVYDSRLTRDDLPQVKAEEQKGADAFCKKEVIAKQMVITGQKVNVLFNYAPIVLGKEKLHFLIVPTSHRPSFTDLSEEEYLESLSLANRLITHYKGKLNVDNVYLMSKTGKDAGQTVDHWHLHVIISTSKANDFWGKMMVFKNILFGSSPMKEAELADRVKRLREDLAAPSNAQ